MALPFLPLRHRRHFQYVAALRQSMIRPLCILSYCHATPEGQPITTLHIGFTVTKKHGNAVVRNRIRRRLRAAVSEYLRQQPLAPGWYVFIPRASFATASYADITGFVAWAARRINSLPQETSS